ncbi:MAG: hypothetical protein RR855_14560 [Comamonas sp.]
MLFLSSNGFAQPRPTITFQEAQTPPRIDADQLRSRRQPQQLEADQLGKSTAIQQLQAQATAPIPKGERAEASIRTQREAAWQWGLLQLHGLHTPLQPVQAQQSFERTHQLGHPLAAAGLAWCAIDGCGQRPDPDAARQWIPVLRKADPGRAAYLEWLLLDDVAPIDLNVPSTARREGIDTTGRKQQLLRQAVEAGDPYARVELGMELAAQGKTHEAMEQFRSAAKRSEAAKHNLNVLSDQKGTLKSRPSGNAGQAGGAWQTFKQARVYHRGEGVPANYTEAIRLYQRASDMGSEPAKRMLALIYSRPMAGGGIDIAWMQQLAYMDVTQDGAIPLTAPTAPTSLTRDPTPLWDYIAPKWRN